MIQDKKLDILRLQQHTIIKQIDNLERKNEDTTSMRLKLDKLEQSIKDYVNNAITEEQEMQKTKKVEKKVVENPKEKLVKRSYGEDVEKKVLKLHKEGKTSKEISLEFNGHPAVPKIKRIIAAQ